MNTHTPTADAPTAADASTEAPPVWTKPGPGSWQLDRSHFEPDCARMAQRIIERGMTRGMADGFERLGGPLAGLEARFVNGNFYYRMIPLVGGNLDLPMPPAPILWLATRLHPAFRRRAKQADRTMEGRLWLDELAEWEDVHRPYLTESARRLTAVDPTALDDDALADHVEACFELAGHGAELHFRLHVSDLGPIGLLLVRAREWGLPADEVMTTLAGSSPATSAPVVALAELRRLAGPGPFASLDEVAGTSAAAAAALDGFLAEYGSRLTTGYDLQHLTLAELPQLILGALNAPDEPEEADADVTARARAVGAAAYGRLSERLDPVDRPEFERLVEDARKLYGLRDENGPLTYQWPAGLLRRAMLVAAERLIEHGLLGEQDHVFDLEVHELAGLLRTGTGPTVEELAERCATRRWWARHDAPELLGRVEDPPPPWTMPSSLALLMDVVITVLDLIESERATPRLQGLGIGTEPHVGRARVVRDEVDALTRMEPGDVLIAPFTVPTYNAALAVAGAVVVEGGGLLSHAAVIAREFGIAGLVGVSGVTEDITDGALVRVDPVAGTIQEVADL